MNRNSRSRAGAGAGKRLFAAFAVVLLAGTGVGATAQAAQAADANVGKVTNVRITDNAGNPITEADIYQGIVVHADWEAPADATPGDYFQISWPAGLLQGVPNLGFDIFSEDPSVTDPIAVCSVTHSELRCVYTNFILDHSETKGSVRYSAQLRAETESITFTADGDVEFTWDIGVTTPEAPGFVPPEVLEKGGHTDTNSGDIYWQVLINPALFPGVDRIEVRDTYESTLSMVPGSISLKWWPTGATNAQIMDLTEGNEYSLAEDPDNNAFDVSIENSAERALGAYILTYHTDVPGDAVEGDTFLNEVVANGIRVGAEVEWTIAGGGSGSGSSYGTFEIVKALSESAAEAGATQKFTGEWACTLPRDGEVVSGTWAVTGAGNAELEQVTANERFPKLPKDAICSATEDSAGAEWAAAVISGDVTISATPAVITVTNSLATQPVGSFSITKKLVDEGGLTPAGTLFTGEYECVAGDVTTGPLPWSLAAGETVVSAAVPVGSVCSVTESSPSAIAGAKWATPVVSEAVEVTGVDSGLVTVTNTLTKEPVVTPPSESGKTPGGGSLAHSGSPLSGIAIGGAVALLAAGLLVLAAKRRETAHSAE